MPHEEDDDIRLEDTLYADSVDCGNYASEEPAADPVVKSEVTV